jgi:hypothetical protein
MTPVVVGVFAVFSVVALVAIVAAYVVWYRHRKNTLARRRVNSLEGWRSQNLVRRGDVELGEIQIPLLAELLVLILVALLFRRDRRLSRPLPPLPSHESNKNCKCCIGPHLLKPGSAWPGANGIVTSNPVPRDLADLPPLPSQESIASLDTDFRFDFRTGEVALAKAKSDETR